ncbi:MAG: hypothetical protein ACOYNC_12545 [Bacteroidales bacterium]
MLKGILILALGIFITTYLAAQEAGKDCRGFFRWEVKTLTDSGGVSLLSARSADSTITHLVSVHPPKRFFILSKKDGSLPRFKEENQVVRVVAIIGKVKTERDRDIHIILRSIDSEDTMIGEIPDPDCRIFDSLPALKIAYTKARKELQQVRDLIGKTKDPVLVEITGIPLWDARHWWLRGCARNGRELHPILSLKILPR